MPTILPIHARVGEVVEIIWHQTDPPGQAANPLARVVTLRERHSAPPLATWAARAAEQGDVTPHKE